MHKVLEQLSSYIGSLHTREKRPFFLLVDEQYRGIDSSGDAAHYGFPEPPHGNDLSAQLLFLVGMEQSQQPELKLPFLDIGHNGISAQVHAIRLQDGWGLAFIDVTREMQHRLQYQQQAHEVELLRGEQEKLLYQLQQAHDELNEKHRALDRANQLKSQFIGRMSHEFRTPLSSIMGFAELAHEDLGEPARIHQDLQAIGRSANYLLTLVDNLLDHAVIENDELAIRPTACDANALLATLEELFQPMAQQRGLSLTWWLGPDLPPRVWLDELRLRQVLVNLISNAIKYTRKGGVTVSLDWQKDELAVDVEDSGPGIQADELESLFKPFNQGGASGNAQRGAGLGLSISREIVQRMGGQLVLKSQPGQGTRAHCDFPAGARARPGEPTEILQGIPVLLLEGDRDNRQLLEIYLLGAGCEVTHASDGEDCARLAAEREPALVLVALEEAGNNAATSRRIRQQGYDGPLIAIGPREEHDSYQAVLAAGFSDLVSRPIGRSELLRQLAGFLQHGAA